MNKSRDTGTAQSGASAVDRLRMRIDRGETGDKVAVVDPAAAPLGTDAEAGGFSPTLPEARMEEDQGQVGPAIREAAGRTDPEPSNRRTSLLVILSLAVVATLILALVM
jgi:hypothetical protein